MTERRRVLITGSSRGIGAAIARELAAGGFHVLLSARERVGQAEELAEELGGDAAPFGVDLSERGAPDRLFAWADGGGPVARIEAVIDATQNPPQPLFYRDLTDLGRGYSLPIVTR